MLCELYVGYYVDLEIMFLFGIVDVEELFQVVDVCVVDENVGIWCVLCDMCDVGCIGQVGGDVVEVCVGYGVVQFFECGLY